MTHSYRVVAAIDFGTHGSGFAWTMVDPRWRTKSDRQIYDFTNWPDARDGSYPKTLSALLLHNGQLAGWGHTAARKLGEQPPGAAEPGKHDQGYRYLAGMKMSLRPADDTETDADRLEDPVPTIAMYLRELANKAIAEITRGGAYTPADIRWCLTVPAIWDQRALDAMRRAAALAGLPDDRERLLLIPEPDAAALYCDVVGSRTIVESATTGRGVLRPKMRFLVIDCGGGTVDLVSYEVTTGGKLDQLRPAGGGALGAEFTTRAFLFESLAKRFGGRVDLALLERRHPRQFGQMSQQWEEQRNTFRVGDTEPIYVDIAKRLYEDLPEAAIERLRSEQDGVDDQIVLEPEEVCELLEGVVAPILGHIDDQLSGWQPGPRDGDMAFLVGGFANSPYLQERITAHLAGRLPVRLAPRPERAVLFGAVHYCYDPTMLRARRARYTYGCGLSMPVRSGDRGDYLVTSSGGVEYTQNRFEIFVRFGDKVPVDQEIKHTAQPLSADHSAVRVTFYSTLETDPYYVTDGGVKEEMTLTIPLGTAMGRPPDERTLDIYLKFGEADIQARVVNTVTGTEQIGTFDFESDL